MNMFPQIAKRTAMASAIAVTLGTTAPLQTASATVYVFEWDGLFTMLTSAGAPLTNTSLPYNNDPTWGYGYRTQITGELTYDDATGATTITVDPFDFFNGGPAVAHDIEIEPIGDGTGGAGTLLAGKLLFDWNTNNNINVGIIFDADGLQSSVAGLSVGDTISGVGEIPASNAIKGGKYPIGAAPLVTTVYDTDYHNTPTCVANDNCLIADGTNIGGDPMDNGPFPNFNANFDVTSMRLLSTDAGATFTVPADPDASVAGVPGDVVAVNLGTVTDEAAPVTDPTCTVTVEYDDPNDDPDAGWLADDGTNTINVELTGTVTTFTVDWRATTTGGDPDVSCGSTTTTLGSQTVTVTIGDNTAPVLTTVPADFSISVDSTAEAITFEGPTSGRGTVVASDAVDANPTIEWSLDELNWTADTPAADETTTSFGAGVNIVYWRVSDEAGNSRTYQQRVTVNLPTGIVGRPCVVNPDLLNAAIGQRSMEGTFTMRDPGGNLPFPPDPEVTGWMNTAEICSNVSCSDVGASLSSPTPVYGTLWTTSAIRLFDEGTYTFNACPGAIDGNGESSDGSNRCDADNDLTMTVGPNQLGAHMLFTWGPNRNIDVAVVWDYGCGSAELVSTDPDGDGLIGTKMVDGPFKGFNAIFDLSTAAGEEAITSGGYAVTMPAVNNTTAGASPVLVGPGTIGTDLGGVVLTASELSGWGAADDSRVVSSCVGGCFDFSVSGRAAGETIQVVLPLSEPIPYYSLYRKYNAATDSWTNFVSNGTDSVMTAPLNDDGYCPEPGSGDYTSFSSGILAGMLRPDDQCVQLTITDNGPNDDDRSAGVIADPSGVGVTSAPAAPEASTSGGGGCTLGNVPATQRFDLWLLAGLMGLMGLRRKFGRR